MRRTHIYLDTAAATPLDERVLAAMRPYLTREFGNPSSIHRSGVAARRAVETARAGIASVLGGQPDEIIFTSGGTEANNLAIVGVTRTSGKGHIITAVIEHASVLEPCRALERDGWTVTYLPVKPDGLVDPTVLARALRPDTILVSVGYANNEIGVIQPIREIAKTIRRFKKTKKLRSVQHRVSHTVCDTRCCTPPFFHTDACQAPRFLDCRASTLGVDLMTLNNGKIYGPRGIGCLYVRRGLNLQPILYGGGQEQGARSGTENVSGIVGLAKALELCVKLREKESVRLSKLRDYFIKRLLKIEGTTLNGSRTARLPNNVNVSFAGADSEFVVLNLDAAGVAASAGSACSTQTKDNSYVIAALGGSEDRTQGAVRFSLGRETTRRDLDYVLKILPGIQSHVKVRPCRWQGLTL